MVLKLPKKNNSLSLLFQRCNRTIMVLKRKRWDGVAPSFDSRCNRTIMVLKRWSKAICKASCTRVAIEPLWYWNFDEVWRMKLVELVAIEPLWYWNYSPNSSQTSILPLLQSNHYGIETRIKLPSAHHMSCCNRTIMVLKPIPTSSPPYKTAFSVAIEPLWYWNPPSKHSLKAFRTVAIEPLWYWNPAEGLSLLRFVLRCNRTIMVLKPAAAFIKTLQKNPLQSNHYGIETPNRQTHMHVEHKLQSNHYGIETYLTVPIKRQITLPRCNRTIMVLKPAPLQQQHQEELGVAIEPLWYWNQILRVLLLRSWTVAIEPLWYWNTSKKTTLKSEKPLQSNHYGIETAFVYQILEKPHGVAIEPLWYWNKTVRLHLIKAMLVAIEPLWYWNNHPLSSKRCRRDVAIEPLWYWNNLSDQPESFEKSVAIEPLWYWNLFFLSLNAFKERKLQSNHYGIETLFTEESLYEDQQVAIEPLWYWNFDEVWRMKLVELLGCNRTIMVLKPRIPQHPHNTNRTVAIEPLWYWNQDKKPKDRSKAFVAIEPLWYWNQPLRSRNGRKVHVAIEPLWYWNISSQVILAETPIVAIEPLWYWNDADKSVGIRYIRLQSNHYGIETLGRGKWWRVKGEGCNRTIMVLKHVNITKTKNLHLLLQSNHYGIETILMSF